MDTKKQKCGKCKCYRNKTEFGRRPTKKISYFKTCEKCRSWNGKNRDKEYFKQYNEKFNVGILKQKKEYYQKNKDRVNKSKRTPEYRKYTKELRKKAWKKYKITKCRGYDIDKYEWKPFDYIDVEYLDMLIKKYENKCYYCKNDLDPHSTDFSHQLTIERLDSEKPHIKSNCVIACRRCNCSTGSKYRHSKMKEEDKYKNRKDKPVICECGSEVKLRSLTRHKKTLKHINNLKSKAPPL